MATEVRAVRRGRRQGSLRRPPPAKAAATGASSSNTRSTGTGEARHAQVRTSTSRDRSAPTRASSVQLDPSLDDPVRVGLHVLLREVPRQRPRPRARWRARWPSAARPRCAPPRPDAPGSQSSTPSSACSATSARVSRSDWRRHRHLDVEPAVGAGAIAHARRGLHPGREGEQPADVVGRGARRGEPRRGTGGGRELVAGVAQIGDGQRGRAEPAAPPSWDPAGPGRSCRRCGRAASRRAPAPGGWRAPRAA